MPLTPSAHVDTFARDNLPPEDQWPVLEFTLPEVNYPQHLNAAVALVDDTIRAHGGDRIAFRSHDVELSGLPEGTEEVWTYADLARHVNQIAHVLTEDFGIVPGNRVLLRIPNNVWVVACWLAVLRIGAIAVTTMVAWKEAGLIKTAKKTKPSLVIVDHRFAGPVASSIGREIPTLVVGGPDDRLLGAADAKPAEFTAVQTAADDVALFAPTSGTTGEPKVTMHFHRDILANADTFALHTLNIQPDDVCAGSPPFAFTFGLGGVVIFPLRFGASSYLLEKPRPDALAKAVEEHGVTVMYTAPTGYRTILRGEHAGALGKLRVGVSAGEHLPKETFEAVEKASGLRLVDGIGSTEMLHVFVSASGDEIRPGATGKAVPGYRATTLRDDGSEADPGELGRLAIIGPTGCRYLDDPRQQNYVDHGWNVTGDTYIRDEDGYFFYQARSDDMIVTAGYNVGAPEVEAAINMHPDVLECAVVARPDPEKGAIADAFVVVRENVLAGDALREEIKQTVAERLAVYKIPRRIDFVDSLPHNASGKLQRRPLRERAAAEAAAEQQILEGSTR
jgi:2-aminobenzoate-CoA ligase